MTASEHPERSAPLLDETVGADEPSSAGEEAATPSEEFAIPSGSAEADAPTSPAGLSAPEVDAPAVPAAPTEPAAPTAAPQARAKTKGVADVVFLIDVSGSMSPIIDALRKNIEAFVDSLSTGDANNAPPVRDWRGKVVGYRDVDVSNDLHVTEVFADLAELDRSHTVTRL